MFGRRQQQHAPEVVEERLPTDGKGRPTPKRKEAQAARKQRMTPPRDRKEAARAQRERARRERGKTRAALSGRGDTRYLPPRDRGPVRAFCRDFIDARRSVAEFLLPALLVIVVLGMVPNPTARNLVGILWMLTIVLTVADTLFLVWRVGRELKVRFPDENTRGAKFYAVMRSSQMRFLRLPKPQVKPGQKLPDHY